MDAGGGVSVFHWLILLVFWGVLVGIPVSTVLKKAGRSPWWTILAFIPILNMVGLWLFAFTRWPALDKSA